MFIYVPDFRAIKYVADHLRRQTDRYHHAEPNKIYFMICRVIYLQIWIFEFSNYFSIF